MDDEANGRPIAGGSEKGRAEFAGQSARICFVRVGGRPGVLFVVLQFLPPDLPEDGQGGRGAGVAAGAEDYSAVASGRDVRVVVPVVPGAGVEFGAGNN